MKPTTLPCAMTSSVHSLFQQNDLGSKNWWNQVQHIGNPLILKKNHRTHCTFLWRCQSQAEQVFIDIYSQTPSIYQQWNQFQQIENTDIAFFEIELAADWSGSYVLVTTPETAPHTTNAAVRRQWWQKQLQQHAQIDPLNPYPAYPAQVARWVNQVHLTEKEENYIQDLLIQHRSLQWQSTLLETTYPVDLYQTGDELSTHRPLIIFLDGQIWSRHLPILQQLQTLTDQKKIVPACYAFIHSINSEQRGFDYGCRDLFSQALVEELIPHLKQQFGLDNSKISLCCQSLGGLCALHTLLLYPDALHQLILQSGSYWWSDYSQSPFLNNQQQRFLELIPQHIQRIPADRNILIRAGRCETDMREDSEQLYAHLNPFVDTQIHTFAGGHDAVNWRHDLIASLQILLSS